MLFVIEPFYNLLLTKHWRILVDFLITHLHGKNYQHVKRLGAPIYFFKPLELLILFTFEYRNFNTSYFTRNKCIGNDIRQSSITSDTCDTKEYLIIFFTNKSSHNYTKCVISTDITINNKVFGRWYFKVFE